MIKIDFSEVEKIKFKCIEYCGKCCFYQPPVLTTAEIKRILNFLETKTSEDYQESLYFFWSPFLLEEAEEGILVKNYMIHSIPSTGRCLFLNPIDFTCFVYTARPDRCRLYPLNYKIDETGNRRVVVGEYCPGVGLGSPLKKEEIKEIIQRGFVEIMRDVETYEKYINEKGIKRIRRTEQTRKEMIIRDFDKKIFEFERSWREAYFLRKGEHTLPKGKKFIEPFVELGLMPPHPART